MRWALLTRFPRFTLLPQEIPWSTNTILRGPKALWLDLYARATLRPDGDEGFTLCALVCAAAGCTTTSGRLLEDVGARVFLSEGNYRVLRQHVVGESKGVFLLMFIPISSPSYNEAKGAMYKALGEPVQGPLDRAHEPTEDLTEFNALIYSTRTITLSADFIEFNDPNGNKPLRPLGSR